MFNRIAFVIDNYCKQLHSSALFQCAIYFQNGFYYPASFCIIRAIPKMKSSILNDKSLLSRGKYEVDQVSCSLNLSCW